MTEQQTSGRFFSLYTCGSFGQFGQLVVVLYVTENVLCGECLKSDKINVFLVHLIDVWVGTHQSRCVKASVGRVGPGFGQKLRTSFCENKQFDKRESVNTPKKKYLNCVTIQSPALSDDASSRNDTND